MIYFIKCAGRVKIGFSDKPHIRLSKINSDSPFKASIMGLMDGDVSKEKEIHQLFEHNRLRGEWFMESEEILEFVKSNTVKPSTRKRVVSTIIKADRRPVSGADLFDWRKRNRVSQMVLAAKIGVNQGTLSRWERGVAPVSEPAQRVFAAMFLSATSKQTEA